ncbi:Asp23/Gls24 family envelope stress response protein [Agromyces sp. ISL-38]|uniref:Asp23/Gls24 family envelope stress response protein n=1 Tax=Agromyces sp. ISL-38 TaxID=2819107 RepID=UPI001BE50A2B|nr:Asp23/Gls24 family envelope stress response protein [Agromyces sp. ISL-38]MBT2516623.1 Asp23/Gls24 family envelope stress response protein [Streptomyces sp. ISL-90]
MASEEFSTTPTTPAGPAAATSPLGAPRVDRSTKMPASASVPSAGKTTIADSVVAKIAGIAARDVPGVYALGGGGARALGALRDAMNVGDLSQGVKVEVGETQAAADITIVVEYPMPIQDVAGGVRAAVTGAITLLVGLEVVEVNVDVNDVHVPGADVDEESRVS